MKKKEKAKKNNLLKNAIKTVYETKITILLCIAITVSFFLLSNNPFFPGQETINNFSFSISRFWNILPYVFVHNSFVHLIANVSAILVFGFLLERRIGFKHALFLFFLSATIPAILFSIANPQFSIFGASAVSSGLIGAGFLLQPKKTAIAAVILLVVILFAAKPTGMQLYENYKSGIEKEIIKAGAEKDIAVKNNNVAAAQQLAKKESDLKQFLDSLRMQEFIAASTGVANFAHAFGAIVGFAYAYLFVPNRFNARAKPSNKK